MDIDNLEAGPELDILIARKVMGMENGNGLAMVHSGMPLEPWSPSSDYNDTFEIIELLRSEYGYEYELGYSISRDDHDGLTDESLYYCLFIPKGRDGIDISDWPMAEADDLRIAVCRAALKAIREARNVDIASRGE